MLALTFGLVTAGTRGCDDNCWLGILRGV